MEQTNDIPGEDSEKRNKIIAFMLEQPLLATLFCLAIGFFIASKLLNSPSEPEKPKKEEVAANEENNEEEKDEGFESEELSDYEAKLQNKEVAETVEGVTKLMRQQTRSAKEGDDVDKQVAEVFEKVTGDTTKLLVRKMTRSKDLDDDPEDKHAFLNHMSEGELSLLLTSTLPIIKLEPGLYMIGTEKKAVQIKSDRLFIRVGGGFSTVEDYVK